MGGGILESSQKQNLNLLSASNYLHCIRDYEYSRDDLKYMRACT